MVAQRTLTPYVRVRILLPLPKREPHHLVRLSFFVCCGFEPSRSPSPSGCRFSGERGGASVGSPNGVSRSNPSPAAKKRAAPFGAALFFVCCGFEPSRSPSTSGCRFSGERGGASIGSPNGVSRSNPSPAAKKRAAPFGAALFFCVCHEFEPSQALSSRERGGVAPTRSFLLRLVAFIFTKKTIDNYRCSILQYNQQM